MATQNPVEQEGTYQLPEAQSDRFMLKVIVEYPNRDEELQILRRMSKTSAKFEIQPVTSPAEIIKARELVDERLETGTRLRLRGQHQLVELRALEEGLHLDAFRRVHHEAPREDHRDILQLRGHRILLVDRTRMED